MADIRLAKPAAGTTQTVPSAPDGRFIFDFPADAATLTRSGDNLVLTFEDGASIQLQDFYTTYSKEEMPSFQVEGVEISGQDFFAALGEDLMPAAGPAAGSSAARGGRYNEYGGSDLLDGIDHLGRLDVGFDGGVQLATDTVEPSPWYEGDGWVDHGVTVTPLDSDAAAEVVTVHEAGLANGTTPGAADAPVAAGGSLIINAPDGVASIVIGNVTVFENGALTGNTVSTDEGTLTVTGYDPATGRLDFNYTLDRNTTEHDKSDPATDTQISHDLTVTVTDTDGDSGSTTITVNVVDDGPKINLTGASSGLLVDETFGSNGSQDVNDGGTGTATLDASRLFDVDGGADGVADMSYSLTLSQQPNDLTAIVDGQEYNVTFAVFNGQVHAMAGNTGKDIFTVSINEDTGEVTLQLTGKGSLKHPTSSNDDEILNNIIDDINVKLTVTDNDGDVTSSEVQLEIQVEDDAVQVTSAGEPKLELDESDLHGTGVQDVVNVSNNFTVVASADGEAGRSYELTLDPGAENPLVAFVGGEMMPVILSINNEGRIVGMAGDTEIFNVHVDSKGNVTFTLENNGTLVHPDNSDPDDVLSLNGIGVKLTVTDGDGDSSSAEIALDLTIRDDGPVAYDNVNSVTENASASGNVLTDADSAGKTDSFGADGGSGVTWDLSGYTNQEGGTDGTYTVTDGVYTVYTQYGVATLNPDGSYMFTAKADAGLTSGESASVGFGYTIKDSDGDSAAANLTITINGDSNVPTIDIAKPGTGDANIMVDEGALADGSKQHTEHGASGSGSFTVQLNGEDGVITLGYGEQKVELKVENGEFSKPEAATITVNGVAVTVTGATQGADGWTVNYRYELQGDQPHTEADSSDYYTDELRGTITVDVVDATGDSAAQGSITVEVHDDGPTITASDMSTTLVPGGGAGNLDDGQAADFTQGQSGQSLGHETGLDGWRGVTMYAAKVTYSGSGDDVQISNIDDSDSYTLKYSPYKTNGNYSESDWGLTVDAGEHNEEISVIGDNASEAVVFDLGGQLAYGVTIDFGAFYNGEPGAPGTTQWDHVSEKALVTFYRDGEIVGSTIVEGNSSTGTFTLNSSDVVLGGFDKVVISAVDNRTDEYRDEHSDFTIQGIDFITKRDDPIIINEGKVTAKSGADGFADDYQEANAKFDLGSMVNDLSEDGTSGTITVLVNGEEHTVDVKLSEGASGESILTGTIQGGDQLFTATLDKDGNWTMEQYDQFRVPGEGGQGSSNEFDLVFKTEDADGDIVSATVNVPLEVVDLTPGSDASIEIDNGNDTIVIAGGEGVAGTVAAGDSGGVEVQTTVQPGQDYNISIMLDLSGSMADPLHSDTNTSRIEMAVDALKNFFETSLQNHDGDISLQLVGFGTDVLGTRTWTIDGDAFDAEKQWVYDEFANQLNAWQQDMDSWGYSQGTNYEAAMEKATEWFSDAPAQGGVAGNGGENLAFFISDGQPTYYYDGTDWWGDPTVGGEGNHSDQATVQATLEAAQDLQNAGGGVQVNAIGIGNESLHEKAQTILDLIDNTGGSGQTVEEYPYQHEVVVDHDWLGRPKYEWQWTTGKWSENNLVEGDSDLVNSEDGLTAALVGGGVITSTDLADAGDDTIRAEHATSSTIIYGDVMNTDRLRYELIQTRSIAAALVAAGIDYGSGADVFQWLENAANANALKGTKFEGWTHDDSVKYMLQHAEELGYETRVDADGDFYLVKADGTVLNMDGAEADNVELDTLTGRGGGNDTIIGSQADDVIYGQEGNDLLVGDAPSESGEGSTVGSIEGTTVASIKAMDTDDLDAFIQSVEGPDADGDDRLFGGTGDDVLLGMGGDDYIDGGAGEDAIFGGSGNDIIVYDSNDYLVSGGSGIDFMVSDNSTLTLTELLSGGKNGKEGPIVDSIEVLLKGDAALSLTSLDQLAKDYGITLDTNAEGKETLILDMDKWTKTADGTYAFNGGAEDGDLTLETNLTPVEASDPASEAVQQQVFTLEHGNG